MGMWKAGPGEKVLARVSVTFATGAAMRVRGRRWFRDEERNDIQGVLDGLARRACARRTVDRCRRDVGRAADLGAGHRGAYSGCPPFRERSQGLLGASFRAGPCRRTQGLPCLVGRSRHRRSHSALATGPGSLGPESLSHALDRHGPPPGHRGSPFQRAQVSRAFCRG